MILCPQNNTPYPNRNFQLNLDTKLVVFVRGWEGDFSFYFEELYNLKLDHNKRSNELCPNWVSWTDLASQGDTHHLWVYNVHMIIHIVNAELTPVWRKALKFYMEIKKNGMQLGIIIVPGLVQLARCGIIIFFFCHFLLAEKNQ